MAEPVANILTVDVEDWFHVLEADGEGGYSREAWGDLESRVEVNTDRLLGIFDEAGARATFFVVGWIARRHPALVRRIAEAGHSLGSHSFWHEVLGRHDRNSLRADLDASRRLLEDLSGQSVSGFRAPGASITPRVAWSFDLLVEAGYRYDASLCPGVSSHGGYPSVFFGPHRVRCESGWLDEIPSSTMAVAGRHVPYAGGGYLRLLPVAWVQHCIRRDNRNGIPTNVYVHPREIDPGQPRMALSRLRSFKYYVGLASTEAKLRVLLRDHTWVGVEQWLEAHRGELAERVLDVRADARRYPPSPDPRGVPPAPDLDSGALGL